MPSKYRDLPTELVGYPRARAPRQVRSAVRDVSRPRPEDGGAAVARACTKLGGSTGGSRRRTERQRRRRLSDPRPQGVTSDAGSMTTIEGPKLRTEPTADCARNDSPRQQREDQRDD